VRGVGTLAWVVCVAVGAAPAGAQGAGPAAGRAARCDPPAAARPAGATLPGVSLAGEYRLALVADSGVRAGGAAAGRLALHARADTAWMGGGAHSGRATLWGHTDVDLAAVGARVQGSAASTDPAAPGVVVVEIARRAGAPADSGPAPRTGAHLTLGSVTYKDGAETTLSVLELRPGGFGGRWESGNFWAGRWAAGYFCAERVPPRPAP